MAELKFIVRAMASRKPQTICIRYNFGKDRLMYATRLKILPSHWDQDKQRVKNTKYCLNRDEVNEALHTLESEINNFIIQATKDGKPVNKESLTAFIDAYFGKSPGTEAKDFHSFFKLFMVQNKTRINPKTGQIISYKNQREYERTYYYIREYEKSRKKLLNFENITLDFYADFTAYLQSLNLSTNTIGHKIVSLKAVLNAATERGINKNTLYKSQGFRNLSEDSETVALTESELDELFRFNFSTSPKLERVRDLFLIGAWTGLRFSDFTRIKKEFIRDGILYMEQQKTGGHVAIPLHPVFTQIWDKYNGVLPANISNQKFNNYIKEACKEVVSKYKEEDQYKSLGEKVFKSITKGGKKQTDIYRKYQLVSSHTARRSFATNLYKSGFPAISIMKITGHKTEKAFLKYIKVTPEEHAKLLQMHWSKNGSLLKRI